MLPLCQDQKTGVIPWSPVARWLLTGGCSKARNETERAKTDAFGKSLYAATMTLW
jgi:aryl-alcohol dehydrogenase-like predicted oxidoreductase